MKKILFYLILLSTVSAFSQNLNDLDVKNGFKQFKLGSLPSQIKNIQKTENQYSQNPDVQVYEYIGTDIKNIFNVEIQKISLSFFKNKLFNIAVSFGAPGNNFKEGDFKDVLHSLEQAYGKDWIKANNESGEIVNGCIWKAKKVTLELLRIDFTKRINNPRDYGCISGYLNIYDNELTKAMFKSDL